MDRLRAGALGGVEQPLDDEIALGGRAWADQVRLVGRAHVERVAVGLGVDGDGADAELAQRAEDPDRDLAAVRDEDLPERRTDDGHRRILRKP